MCIKNKYYIFFIYNIMSNKIIFEVNELNELNNEEIYPPFFPNHFFIKQNSQKKNNHNNQKMIKQNNLNNKIKSNLPNNNMFFIRKF